MMITTHNTVGDRRSRNVDHDTAGLEF